MPSNDDSATLSRVGSLSPAVATWYAELSEVRENLLTYLERILYHIIEHEAMHLGQIRLLHRLFKLEQGTIGAA